MSREPRFIRSIQAQAKGGVVLDADIGSAQTRISVGNKLIYDQPTCLAIQRHTDSVVAIGEKAYRLLGKSSSSILVIFPIHHGAVASTKYFKLYLQAVKKELTINQTMWSLLTGVTIKASVPDSFSPVERQMFVQTISQAGMGKVTPVSLSKAVSIGVGRNNGSNQTTCVITIGGQSSEIALISANEVVAATNFEVGGVLFTEAVQNHIRKTEQVVMSWHVAEHVKKEIGCVLSPVLSRTTKQKKISINGKDVGNQLGKTIVIVAETVMPAFDDLVADIMLNTRSFFSSVPTELITGALESGIILSGGTARLPGLAEYLSTELHCEVLVSKAPEYDCIHGLQLEARN